MLSWYSTETVSGVKSWIEEMRGCTDSLSVNPAWNDDLELLTFTTVYCCYYFFSVFSHYFLSVVSMCFIHYWDSEMYISKVH